MTPMIKPQTAMAVGNRRPTRHAQRGASLLEGIAYLGIAAIVVLGAVALLTSAFSSANTNRLAQEVNAIQTGVKKLYMGQQAGYTTGDMNPYLAPAGVFPSTLTINSKTSAITNAWGGGVEVDGAGSTFTISYGAVPQDVCINVISSGGNWTSITVDTGTPLAPPYTTANAQAACTAGAHNIIWASN